VSAASTSFSVAPAQVQDVAQIYALMLPYMLDKTLIDRSQDDIFEHLQEFIVAKQPNSENTDQDILVGVAALHIYGANLAEVRSLVVAENARHLGAGQHLVQACEIMARNVGVTRIFALTYVDKFFLKQGYHIVEKETLPQKVWTVCIHCPKFSHCDEIAVSKAI